MKWNDYDFVLSADAQFNGASRDYYPDLAAFRHADLKTEYQTVVSPELRRLMPGGGRGFESADHAMVTHIRGIDHRLSFPAEFFQCILQKPAHSVDFRGRLSTLMHLVRSRHEAVNGLFDRAFRAYHASGRSLDATIGEEVDRLFGGEDAEMRGILKGYLTQKPQRAIFMIDIESAPASFRWLEPVYQGIKSRLLNVGLQHIASVSGKGYHFLSQVPLHKRGYGLHDGQGDLNYAMINLMSRGGPIKPETIDRLVSVRWGSRKHAPTPLLAQRAYQGMYKLQQHFLVNNVDHFRYRLRKAGMAPWINFSDTEKETVILDITAMLRQVEMCVFGSVGSLYNKARRPTKVRVIRSRNGHEYFGNDLRRMLLTRSDLGKVKHHLIATGGRIPDGTRGVEAMIRAYDASRIKRELHGPCDRALSSRWIASLIKSNYAAVRRRCPAINGNIDRAQPDFLDPKALKWVYDRMLRSGYSVHSMMTLTKAIYGDPLKRTDIDSKYSKDEWSRWPTILLGERFKG